jgi:hypothetical protein
VSLLLHAITTPPTAEPDPPLVRVEAGGLMAWATQLGSSHGAFDREDALRHHMIVMRVCSGVEACLPARFPTVVADEQALRSQLAAQCQQLTRRLELVRGACELGATLVWTTLEEPAAEVGAPTPGRRYLEQRRAALAGSDRRHTRATELAETLEREGGEALRAAVRRVCPSTDVALSLALLVERTAADELKQRLRAQAWQDVRILVHGPWPPYTFVERRDGGAQA